MTDQTAAVWIDGDPLMEAIASAVWEQCRTDHPSSVVDDPRNIAAVAAAAARAHQAAGQAPADRAAVLREAADVLDTLPADASSFDEAEHKYKGGAAAETLRRMADEAQQPSADPSWPRRAWDLGLLHKGGDPHHCPACVAQPEPPKDFICPGAEANAEVLANPQPAVEAQQPTQRNIQCPDAFWRPRPHAPHNWQQGPDTQPVHCPGVPDTQQPKEADGERVVAYISSGGNFLYCTRHRDELGINLRPVLSEDLPGGGTCCQCGADLLIPQQPKES